MGPPTPGVLPMGEAPCPSVHAEARLLLPPTGILTNEFPRKAGVGGPMSPRNPRGTRSRHRAPSFQA